MRRKKISRLAGDLAAQRGEELVQAGEDELDLRVPVAPGADFFEVSSRRPAAVIPQAEEAGDVVQVGFFRRFQARAQAFAHLFALAAVPADARAIRENARATARLSSPKSGSFPPKRRLGDGDDLIAGAGEGETVDAGGGEGFRQPAGVPQRIR